MRSDLLDKLVALLPEDIRGDVVDAVRNRDSEKLIRIISRLTGDDVETIRQKLEEYKNMGGVEYLLVVIAGWI